jgi:hypothetical protein
MTINGTEELDSALESLAFVLNVVNEEKWSVDYTHNHAPLTGRILAEKMKLNEIVEFDKTLKESTRSSRENIDKVLKILNMTSDIMEHYAKLSEIGDVWEEIICKNIDDLRCYQ